MNAQWVELPGYINKLKGVYVCIYIYTNLYKYIYSETCLEVYRSLNKLESCINQSLNKALIRKY
jgi:hypothetical protein